ncbi:hypothetical protein D3C81_2041060 [compost metagenome]
MIRAFFAGRSIRIRDTAAFFSLAFRYSRTLMSSASMPAKSRLLAYQRLAQFRLIARRKPVGWIFCPIFFQAFQLPTVTYTWHVGLLIRLPRPLARAVKRLSVVPCST